MASTNSTDIKKTDKPHELELADVWFNYMKDGRKKVEGRLWDKTENYKVGDTILFKGVTYGSFEKKISEKMEFKTFEDALNFMNGKGRLDEVLPGIKTVAEGVELYNAIYTAGKYGKRLEKGVCFLTVV